METDKIHLLSIEMKTGTGKWQTLSQDLIVNLCNNFEVLGIDLCSATDVSYIKLIIFFTFQKILEESPAAATGREIK